MPAATDVCAPVPLERCGLTAGCRVIPVEQMLRKIAVALEARTDPNLMLVARTDAHGQLGFEEALERGKLYAQAGADIIFVQGIQTEAQLTAVCRGIDKPCLVNITSPQGLGTLAPSRLSATGCSLSRARDARGDGGYERGLR